MKIFRNFFLITILSVLMIPSSAFAFCGFYVGGAGAEMFADATQVVLLRDGTRTVLSMQNRYEGPLADFAMVIPVSEVIMKTQVKTLEPEIFKKIDTLSSPRLVEYWEQDPCRPDYGDKLESSGGFDVNNSTVDDAEPGAVKVEAQFAVGEYEISVLSTTESSALETWLTTNGFALPTGASIYLEPYVQSGNYFFAAKVNTNKVKFDAEGRAVLSPLRFHVDSEDFQLPIRLGMINSNGKQDLIVYILADQQRYELKNYPNAFVPTNIRVVDDVRNDFASFYKSIFARTVKENPGAAITEYSWSASSCDPCPGPVVLTPEDVATLGADVISNGIDGTDSEVYDYKDWTLTRIHLQYEKDEIGEDLIFKKADRVVGGREIKDDDGKLEHGAQTIGYGGNAFQARYIIRHAWTGAVSCADPRFGEWGGNPEGNGEPTTFTAQSPNSTGGNVFGDGAKAENVGDLLLEDIPELNITAKGKVESGGGCSATDTNTGALSIGVLLFLGFVLVGRRRKK